MSYSDYANIIAGYNSKSSSRREASEGRYANFKSGFRERGLASMSKFEEQANQAYNKTLEDAQTSALKALGINEQQQAKAQAILGAAMAGGPVVDKLLKLGKSKTKKGAKGLADKLKQEKTKQTEVRITRSRRERGLEDPDKGLQDKGLKGADDLVGQERISEEPEISKLSEKARGKQPLRNETRGGDMEMTGMPGRETEMKDLNPRGSQGQGISSEPLKTVDDLKTDKFFEDAQKRVGLDPNAPSKSSTQDMDTFLDDAESRLQAPAAEAPATEEGGAEALETLGEDVALDEAAAAPLDVIPGIGEIAAAGAAIYGAGQFFGLWGGGSHKKEEPIPLSPHMTTSVQTGANTGSYRGLNRAIAAPTINSGIMR